MLLPAYFAGYRLIRGRSVSLWRQFEWLAGELQRYWDIPAENISINLYTLAGKLTWAKTALLIPAMSLKNALSSSTWRSTALSSKAVAHLLREFWHVEMTPYGMFSIVNGERSGPVELPLSLRPLSPFAFIVGLSWAKTSLLFVVASVLLQCT